MSRQRLAPVDRGQNRQPSQSSDALPVVADTAQRLKVTERGGSTVRFRYDVVTLKVVGIGQPTRPASVVVCCDTSQSQCPWNQSLASVLCHCRSPFRPPLGGGWFSWLSSTFVVAVRSERFESAEVLDCQQQHRDHDHGQGQQCNQSVDDGGGHCRSPFRPPLAGGLVRLVSTSDGCR